jgi:hypothetical protein
VRPPNPYLAALAELDARAAERTSADNWRIARHVSGRSPRACAICYGTGDLFEPHDLAAPREAASCPECLGLGTVPQEKR